MLIDDVFQRLIKELKCIYFVCKESYLVLDQGRRVYQTSGVWDDRI